MLADQLEREVALVECAVVVLVCEQPGVPGLERIDQLGHAVPGAGQRCARIRLARQLAGEYEKRNILEIELVAAHYARALEIEQYIVLGQGRTRAERAEEKAEFVVAAAALQRVDSGVTGQVVVASAAREEILPGVAARGAKRAELNFSSFAVQ